MKPYRFYPIPDDSMSDIDMLDFQDYAKSFGKTFSLKTNLVLGLDERNTLTLNKIVFPARPNAGIINGINY